MQTAVNLNATNSAIGTDQRHVDVPAPAVPVFPHDLTSINRETPAPTQLGEVDFRECPSSPVDVVQCEGEQFAAPNLPSGLQLGPKSSSCCESLLYACAQDAASSAVGRQPCGCVNQGALDTRTRRQ